jgi:hypothetical protein
LLGAAVGAWLTACGAPAGPPAEPTTRALPAWRVPDGFKSETIPFPLDFAPGITHQGNEELRFPPGFFDPAAPGYLSYTFAWRTDDAAAMDAPALAGELTAYFRGLIAAVDDKHEITGDIAVQARPAGPRFALSAVVYDAFKTKQRLELTGWAARTACGGGALWRFVLAPATTGVRPQLEALAGEAACGQRVPPPPPPKPPAPASR